MQTKYDLMRIEEQERLNRETAEWRRTARGKIVCPECDARGWPGGRWILKHLKDHTHVCDFSSGVWTCGKVFTTANGLINHKVRTHP
jgi:hypothetical protein